MTGQALHVPITYHQLAIARALLSTLSHHVEITNLAGSTAFVCSCPLYAGSLCSLQQRMRNGPPRLFTSCSASMDARLSPMQVNDRMLGSMLRDFLTVLEEYAERSHSIVNATTSDINLMR